MNTIKKNLVGALNQKSAVVGVIGLGYVGLPLALRYAEAGYTVIGFDIDDRKVSSLSSAKSYIEHISDSRIRECLNASTSFTSNLKDIERCDALIICVPTPLSRHREPNMEYVISTMESLTRHLHKGQIISLESTTYPGTTAEELLPRIQQAGFTVGKDFFLIYSPEREDPGNDTFDTQSIPKIVGGHTLDCRDVGVALYQKVINQVVPVSSTRVAEMTKLLENIHRAVNIGLVNEMKMVSDKMGIDIHEVIRAASTKPFGFTPYYPGPGLGGHCIPIDPFYLTWKAREYGVHTRFIELAGEVNSSMPTWVAGKVVEALNKHNLAASGSKILILGIAYKKNVDDVRESPGVKLMALLKEMGADVAYSDPHIPQFPIMRDYRFETSSVKITKKSIENFDCILLATDHSTFDYPLISQHAKLIVDTRGVFDSDAKNVVKA